MKVLAITGGIGSGKSTISRIFEILNIPIYYTDIEAKRIMNESPEVRQGLIRKFGEETYPNNTLDKKRLSNLIFNNTENLEYVNSIVHPEVHKDFLCWKTKHNKYPIVGFESAILFESGFDRLADLTITVTAPLETRIQRVQQRDNASREAIMERISNQMSEEEKTVLSDRIIINDGIHALLPQVEELFAKK